LEHPDTNGYRVGIDSTSGYRVQRSAN